MEKEKEEVNCLKKELSNYLNKDIIWLQDIENIKSQKEQRKKEYRNNLKIKNKNKTLKNLCITGYIALTMVPFLIAGSFSTVGVVGGIKVAEINFKTEYYYIDNTGVSEKLEYDIDNSQVIIKTPYEEENGKYIRKVYTRRQILNDKKKKELLEKDYLEVLSANNYTYVKEEILDENSNIENIDNKGIVGYVEAKDIISKNDDIGNKVGSGICFGVIGIVAACIPNFLLLDKLKRKKSSLSRKRNSYESEYVKAKEEEKILKKEYNKYKKL